MTVQLQYVNIALAILAAVLGGINIHKGIPEAAWPWFLVTMMSVLNIIKNKVFTQVILRMAEEIRKLKDGNI